MAIYRKPYRRRYVVKRGVGVYHCYGRTVDRQMLFDDGAKEQFVRMLRQAAVFSGVEILTYCVMTNHYHLLVRVDSRAAEVGDAELVRRFRILYGERRCPYLELTADGLEAALREGPDAEAFREHLRSRMGCLAPFMKTLKQRFSVWFNKSHERVGTLWAERYQSVLIENDPVVLRTVAAYIDLNAVEAGLVGSPGGYRWCGFGAWRAGDGVARAGLLRLCTRGDQMKRASQAEQEAVLKSYGRRLQALAEEDISEGAGVGGVSPAIPRGPVESGRRGTFVRGAVVGTNAFVAQWCEASESDRRVGPRAPTCSGLKDEAGRSIRQMRRAHRTGRGWV